MRHILIQRTGDRSTQRVISNNERQIMSDINLPGVPDGWVAEMWGAPKPGDWILPTSGGEPLLCNKPIAESVGLRLIVRRVEPVCVWPRGVLAYGWLAMDQNGSIWWHESRPQVSNTKSSSWVSEGFARKSTHILGIKFRDGLPWDQCIQQVGPTFEGGVQT